MYYNTIQKDNQPSKHSFPQLHDNNIINNNYYISLSFSVCMPNKYVLYTFEVGDGEILDSILEAHRLFFFILLLTSLFLLISQCH